MKVTRTLCLMLVVFLLCAALFPAALATDLPASYTLSEIGISVTVPDGYWVFTRDTREDDPNISGYGMSYSSLMEYFYDSDVYLCVSDPNLDYELEISILPDDTTTTDFADMSDETLEAYYTVITDRYGSQGLNVVESSIDTINGTPFLYYHMIHPFSTGDIHVVEYYTVKNAISYEIMLYSYSGEPSSDAQAMTSTILDSIQFLDSTAVDAVPSSAAPESDEIISDNITANPETDATDSSVFSITTWVVAAIVFLLLVIIILVIVLIVSSSRKKKQAQFQTPPPFYPTYQGKPYGQPVTPQQPDVTQPVAPQVTQQPDVTQPVAPQVAQQPDVAQPVQPRMDNGMFAAPSGQPTSEKPQDSDDGK